MFRFFNSPFKVQTTSLWIGVLIVWLFTSCSSPPSAGISGPLPTSTSDPPKVIIQIEVQDVVTQKPIVRAEVRLNVDGEVFPFEYTDSKGLAVFSVDQQLLQEIGTVSIANEDYQPQTHRISLENSPTLTVYLAQLAETPIPAPTNTLIPSLPITTTSDIEVTNTQVPTPTPTHTPAPLPSPVSCDNPDIVPGIFAQLAQENTSSFIGKSDAPNAPDFECMGVYDRSNLAPPSLKLQYTEASNTYAFYGIGISESFDASGFSQICISVFTMESNQNFDLELKDTNGMESGIEIFPTKLQEWGENCVDLSGYETEGVDLGNISVITLSFNDSFGSVDIWVDDFEFK